MAKNIKNYSNYQLFDFLLDPDFKSWILNPDPEINSYWEQVLAAYPQKRDTIEKAAKIVKNLPDVKTENRSNRANQLWDKIDEEINVKEAIASKAPRTLKVHYLQYTKYAAVLIAAACILFAVNTFQNAEKITVFTGNGQNKSVTLPDGSILQLAPNSSVSFRKNINHQTQREVWATGDVNFNVKHINQNPEHIKKGERFVVHLNQAINVQVLGTVFSISERSGNAVVHLQSGSVKISKANQELLLKPGESAISNTKTQQLSLDKTAPKFSHEWESHVLSLNKTKISTIINIINYSYGVKLIVSDKNILNKEIDGAIPLDDFEKAFSILGSITDGKLQKPANAITINK
nr:FecR family protein [Pedobacter sp. ASV2]